MSANGELAEYKVLHFATHGLIVSSYPELSAKITSFNTGADDYMTKPFNLDELLLRVKGMLRRKAWYKNIVDIQPEYSLGDIKINFENLSFTKGDKKYSLSQREAMVIRYLIERKNQVVSRKELLENVWQISPEIETRTVDIFISRLRKYFEADPSHPIYIKSVRGAGYIFTN